MSALAILPEDGRPQWHRFIGLRHVPHETAYEVLFRSIETTGVRRFGLLERSDKPVLESVFGPLVTVGPDRRWPDYRPRLPFERAREGGRL